MFTQSVYSTGDKVLFHNFITAQEWKQPRCLSTSKWIIKVYTQYCGGQLWEKILEMLIQDKTLLGIKSLFIVEGIHIVYIVHCNHIRENQYERTIYGNSLQNNGGHG
jgi:hypothetical protein